MAYSILKYLVFLLCFGVCMYACTGIQFEKFMKVKEPRKVIVLLFILSVVLASLLSQAVLDLTVLNGLGI